MTICARFCYNKILTRKIMNKETILAGIVALLIGGISGYAVSETNSKHRSSGSTTGSHMSKGMEMHKMPDGSMMDGESHMADADGMNHMMSMTVASEQEFITSMIPHHLEAVETAKEVIARGGTTPEIMQLAENIVIAQEKEIIAMKEWYKNWYGQEYVADGKYEPMMRELADLSGEELDRAFLEDMIMHHMGAIMMARSVSPHIKHDEIKTLTEAIISSQSEEIAQMELMLNGL
jgi:uncharacterized protein (DUF305 family)